MKEKDITNKNSACKDEVILLPNVIIAGSPKCGTTSLFEYIAIHPEVCPSNVKETYYLIDAGYPLYNEQRNIKKGGLAGYSQFFNACKGTDYKIYLEATPDYIYQNTPHEILPLIKPIPMILFLLRKPSERIYSLFRFAKNNMGVLDQRLTFAQFLKMIKESHPFLKDRLILKNAIEHSKYSIYLKRWQKSMGESSIRVYLFEEMVGNPLQFLRQVASDLGIEASLYDTFEFGKKNITVFVKNQALHHLKRRYADLFPAGSFRSFLGKIYRWLNISATVHERTDEDIRLLSDLDSEFKAYNEELSSMTGLDLSLWRT